MSPRLIPLIELDCLHSAGFPPARLRRVDTLGNLAVGVLYGVGHSDRLLNRLLDAPQVEAFRWDIAAVEEYACDAMRLDTCGND